MGELRRESPGDVQAFVAISIFRPENLLDGINTDCLLRNCSADTDQEHSSNGRGRVENYSPSHCPFCGLFAFQRLADILRDELYVETVGVNFRQNLDGFGVAIFGHEPSG